MRASLFAPAALLCLLLAAVGAVLLRSEAVPLPAAGEAATADLPFAAAPLVESLIADQDPIAESDAESMHVGEDRIEPAAADDAAVAEAGPRLLVERGDPAVGAGGVEVAWVAVSHGRRLRAAQAPGTPRIDDLDLAVRFGQRARTGADGRLQLPALQEPTLVTATADNEFAGGVVEPRHRDYRLRLVADRTLHLTVVDAVGRPRALVPLHLFRVDRRNSHVWQGSTEANGATQVPHFQQRQGDSRQPSRFALGAAVPGADPQAMFVEFDWTPDRTEPVVLVLPATAPLALTFRHRSGAPILMPLRVQFEGSGHHEDRWPVTRAVTQPTVQKPLGDVPLELPHVGLGRPLAASLQLRGSRSSRLERVPLPPIVTPPDADRIDWTTTLPDPLCVLAARFVDDQDQPLAGKDLQVALADAHGTLRSEPMATLADGRADLVLLAPSEAALRFVVRASADDGTVVGTTVELSPLLAGERRDLGTLPLRPEPLLARGTVRDDRGVPVAGAQVRIEIHAERRGKERWEPAPYLIDTSADDGSFAVHGAVPQQAFRLHASARGHFDFAEELRARGTRLDLRLCRHGVLTGRILVPGWLPDDAVRIAIQRVGDGHRPVTAKLQRRRGLFWIGGLEPGLYSASVELRNLQEPLAAVENIAIAPGPNEDPRLSGLDIGDHLFRYQLRAIGPRGPLSDLAGPILWQTQRRSGEPTTVTFRWQKGRAEIIAPAPLLNLVTLGPGLAPTEINLGPGESDVYLEPVQPFAVALPGVRGAAGPTRSVRVSAIFTGDTGLPQGSSGTDQRSGEDYSFSRWELGKSGGGWLDPFDRAELVLSRGGPHEIVLRVYEGDQPKGRQASIPLGTVDVVIDGSARSIATLAVPQDALQEALRSLEPQPEQPRPADRRR